MQVQQNQKHARRSLKRLVVGCGLVPVVCRVCGTLRRGGVESAVVLSLVTRCLSREPIQSSLPLSIREPKMVESKPNEFFPKIGQVAEKTDALKYKDISEQTEGDDDGDRPVEEIESLCMNCGEQVREQVVIGSGFAERFGC